jgi:hypothetical protein
MNMNVTKYKLKATFTTSVLGTQPQKNVATEYITSKIAGDNGNLPADELATLPESLEKGTTAFHKLNGSPIFYDYQIKGFLKDAGAVFNGLRNVKNLKSKLDNYVFISPRQIEIRIPQGAEIGFCERPLRAMTAQGARTALARSEELPVGTSFECVIEVYEDSPISENMLRDLLSYGARKGIGQWRNGSHGRFEFTLEKIE